MAQKDWFKLKKYPHIGLPLEYKDRKKWIENYVTSTEKISKHSFLPFIHRVSLKRRYRRDYDENGNLKKHIMNNVERSRIKNVKKRELFYASHLDSLIYSYYTQKLSEPYENKLIAKQLQEVVTAYRRIPKDENSPNSANKCNIDFANDIFKLIKHYPEEKFSVITFDIKSFFDKLDHGFLLQMLMEVLDVKKLEKDLFNIYKNITRFSYVDIQDLFTEYQNEIICQKINRSGQKLPETKKRVSRLRYLKNQDAKAFCITKDFVKNKKHLIKSNKLIKDEKGNLIPRTFGIPQGSPISSLLANIYLINFDDKINNFISSKGGVYRRYSDDMIVVCKDSDADEIENLFYKEIKGYKLQIQPTKTQRFVFERNSGELSCGQVLGGVINRNKNLIYLGFEYDGTKVLLKSASLAVFYNLSSINKT